MIESVDHSRPSLTAHGAFREGLLHVEAESVWQTMRVTETAMQSWGCVEESGLDVDCDSTMSVKTCEMSSVTGKQ